MTFRSTLTVLVACAAVAAADQPRSIGRLATDLDQAVRSYDLPAATAVLSNLREAGVTDRAPQLEELQVRASLAVSELLRLEFEGLGEGSAEQRRILGQRIDATAEEGLEGLAGLPESSEHQRIRADLIATMIRSDFRARKYESEFRAAVDRALELDEGNARAWVSAAKPYLFAPPESGRDLAEGIRLLDRALALDPGLEAALLLRAHAYDLLGDAAAAERDWRAALRINPASRPALERLGATR